jgi:hypothetical protein
VVCMGKRELSGDKGKVAVMKRKGKREREREDFRFVVGEITGMKDEDFGEGGGVEVEEDVVNDDDNEIGKRCLCGAGESYEDCICYLRSKARRKELENKLGKEKFLKKQLIDELTQILIEYDY